jgi:hypothetical protein
LRQESVEGGLLSPNSLAGHVAMIIRRSGHELFDTMITSLGSSCLLPYTRRILKIIHHGILTSSSSIVRRVIDPSSVGILDGGKRDRWLHTSIASRIAAIQSFQYTLLTFGIDAPSLSGANSYRSSTRYVERSVSIICGTIIEELSSGCSTVSMDWGALEDRARLVAAGASCLAACLNSGGSFLSMSIRDLMDIVTKTSLSSILHNQPVSSYGDVKASVINLGIAAMCTPWQDGAASSIHSDLMVVAKSCLHDPNDSVAWAATAALNVGTTLRCPRVPALHVVTRSNHFLGSDQSSNTIIAADTFEDKLQTARAEVEKMKAKVDLDALEMKAPKRAKSIQVDMVLKESIDIPVMADIVPPSDIHNTKVDDTVDQASSITLSQQELLHTCDDMPTDSTEKSSPLENMDDDDFPVIVDCGPDEEDE